MRRSALKLEVAAGISPWVVSTWRAALKKMALVMRIRAPGQRETTIDRDVNFGAEKKDAALTGVGTSVVEERVDDGLVGGRVDAGDRLPRENGLENIVDFDDIVERNGAGDLVAARTTHPRHHGLERSDGEEGGRRGWGKRGGFRRMGDVEDRPGRRSGGRGRRIGDERDQAGAEEHVAERTKEISI